MTVLEFILTPDPCAYHTDEPGWFIDLMYDSPAYEDYHPVPSLVSILLGAVLGSLTAGLILRTVMPKV